MRAAQEAKKFSRITREERTPPKVFNFIIVATITNNSLSHPSITFRLQIFFQLRLSDSPQLSTISLQVKFGSVFTAADSNLLWGLHQLQQQYEQQQQQQQSHHPTSLPLPSAALFLTTTINDSDPSTFCTPLVISTTINLSHIFPFHTHPPLLLAILEKISGSAAAAPLTLLLLQVVVALGFGVWGLGFGVWGLGFGDSVFASRVSLTNPPPHPPIACSNRDA